MMAKPRRVLIADDHAPTRDDLRRALKDDERFEVCASAANAAEAVQAAVRERPDICLLDIGMPGSGLAAAWEIVARLPQAKIVMLTVSDDDAGLFAALRVGAHGYLLKTLNLKRLPDTLFGVCCGEAAMHRAVVARVLERFHGRDPRWRHRLVLIGARRYADPADPGFTWDRRNGWLATRRPAVSGRRTISRSSPTSSNGSRPIAG